MLWYIIIFEDKLEGAQAYLTARCPCRFYVSRSIPPMFVKETVPPFLMSCSFCCLSRPQILHPLHSTLAQGSSVTSHVIRHDRETGNFEQHRNLLYPNSKLYGEKKKNPNVLFEPV